MKRRKAKTVVKQKRVAGTNRRIDSKRKAKPVGWRTVTGTRRKYWEDRENRSDKRQKAPKGKRL